MKGSVLAFAAVFTLCLAGCSSDPSASDFEAFAREYAEKMSGEKVMKDSGRKFTAFAHLEEFDLRKTDSVVSPFVGTAVFLNRLEGCVYRDTRLDGYETPVTYINKSTVDFAYREGKWVPTSAMTQITAVDAPNISDPNRKLSVMERCTRTEPQVATNADYLERGDIWQMHGSAFGTLQSWKSQVGVSKN